MSGEPLPSPRPLPEGQWLWRRLFVWAAALGLWGLLAASVGRAPAADQARLAEDLIALLGLVMVLYLVAPSAQQLVELAAALRLRLREGRR